MATDLLFSIDVESDGPIPGPNSMLNFGCAVFRSDSEEILATYEANLLELSSASPDPDTMDWWRKQDPAVWASIRKNAREPYEVMPEFANWVDRTAAELGGSAVAVAYPAGYDFTFMYWYLRRFAKYSPFGFSCLDAKTLAMAKLGKPYKHVTKHNFPKEWFGSEPHTHRGLDDAIEQGRMVVRMLQWEKK